MTLYEILVTSVATYASETWILRDADERIKSVEKEIEL
jgi:hypothetical protein